MAVLQQLLQVAWDTCVYWSAFLYLWWWQQPIDSLEVFGEHRQPLCHVYCLAMTLRLWDCKHYRAASLAADLRDNLKNVAIPGTGIPLSIFCHCKGTALLFILVVNPAISLMAAVYCSFSSWWRPNQQDPGTNGTAQQPASVAATYRQLLLFPEHWFAIWRHSCLLVGYHALVTRSSSYRMEAKGIFLLEGQRLGLPVSPFYQDAAVFVKHVSVEGGMGIHVFRNFAQGGDWVIQPSLSNSPELSQLLPPGAPLSTLRVVTASTAWLMAQQAPGSNGNTTPGSPASWLQQQQPEGRSNGHSQQANGQVQSSSAAGQPQRRRGSASSNSGSNNNSNARGRLTPELPLSASVMQDGTGVPQLHSSSSRSKPGLGGGSGKSSSNGNGTLHGSTFAAAGSSGVQEGPVSVVTAVWRAGLAGKDTDHSSICFPMDLSSGVLSQGVSANHWYKLGVSRWLGRLDTSTAGHTWQAHPDSGAQVAGAVIPDVARILQTVSTAHMVAVPDVPLAGWDVALTPSGVLLLEVNLSCNLFNGAFDVQAFYDSMFLQLRALDAAAGAVGDAGVCGSCRLC